MGRGETNVPGVRRKLYVFPELIRVNEVRPFVRIDDTIGLSDIDVSIGLNWPSLL